MGELILSTIVITVNDKKIGLKLKKARMDSGLSQEEVGSKIGVTWEMISRYENGRSSPLKHIEKFSTLYEKPISYFVSDEEDAKESFDLEDLVKKLKDEGIGFTANSKNVVKLINHFSGRGIDEDLSNSDQYYEVGTNLTDKYPELFALVINESLNNQVEEELRSGDVALLAPTNEAEEGDIVIGYDGINYKLMNYDKESLDMPLAKLISIERKFIS
jgi:transcriptional regulator with XRE-family HTH domain